MSQKRARITDDNDPLTSTDRVLASFEQVSRSTSQPADKSTSSLEETLDLPEGQLANKSASQPVEMPQSRQPNKSTSQEVSVSESQPVEAPVRQVELRKATFQIDRRVLEQLDRYHLQLQIDRGKSRTPYKEVIVEEAIVRWLEQAGVNPDLFEALVDRQQQREGG